MAPLSYRKKWVLAHMVGERKRVITASISILPPTYQSTMRGTSVRPRAPPKAVPDIPTWVSGLVESQLKGECVGAIAPSGARGAPAYVAR
jgi:hypothetical protein